MADSHGPTAGDRVSTQDLTFTVARRIRSKSTGVVFLIAPDGGRHLLADCQLDALFSPDSFTGKTFIYAGDTAKLQKQFSDIKLTVLRHNGAFAQCRGDNGSYYSWVPLDDLKEVAS